ncbi:MAG: acyl-CoA ligase (AMP-forming), exosortase A system-associated, partial [Betaproteobacteria bacterium HGW-Betaproteobacteria-21]
MTATYLLHQLVLASAERTPGAAAITFGADTRSYANLASEITAFAAGLLQLGIDRTERVGIYLDKRIETATAFFGITAAGGVFVPVNPILKAEQVGYILQDCNVRVLVTSPERFTALKEALTHCHDLRHVILTNTVAELPTLPGASVHRWSDILAAPPAAGHRIIDTDMAAILYTSGSTGRPKGVVLSHRNMVAGAKSVAQYLENRPDDTLLAALPLSFDAGFSQLTTAFHAGARVVLLNYL